MIAADRPERRSGKLIEMDAQGRLQHRSRSDLGAMFNPGDVVVANDAATLPASLFGVHEPSGRAVEVRLAGWIVVGDPSQFVAVVFGDGDYRTPTEHREPPPHLSSGDRLQLGPLTAIISQTLDHPRLVELRLAGSRRTIVAALARHGSPVQYAHVPVPVALWDVWTALAADPVAFEPPSSGFALDWRTLSAWRERGVHLHTITHAAGLSSTGDPKLDARLPFDEPYVIPLNTAGAILRAQDAGRRVVAVGTTVVRALEAAVSMDGRIASGRGVATNRIGHDTTLRTVDAILTGMHEPGESHYELLGAFASAAHLDSLTKAAGAEGYRGHEFGDSALIHSTKTVHPGAQHGDPKRRRA